MAGTTGEPPDRQHWTAVRSIVRWLISADRLSASVVSDQANIHYERAWTNTGCKMSRLCIRSPDNA